MLLSRGLNSSDTTGYFGCTGNSYTPSGSTCRAQTAVTSSAVGMPAALPCASHRSHRWQLPCLSWPEWDEHGLLARAAFRTWAAAEHSYQGDEHDKWPQETSCFVWSRIIVQLQLASAHTHVFIAMQVRSDVLVLTHVTGALFQTLQSS